MGCLGFRPKKLENFDRQTLKYLVVDKIFRLKEISEAFNLNYHYTWIIKHWKKLLKAFVHDKWQYDIPYSTLDVSLCKNKYDNVSFTTNMFDNGNEGFNLDENGKVVTTFFDKQIKIATFPIVDIVYDSDSGMDFVYSTKYLNELKNKKLADPEQSIASIELICLDYKAKKYISYIIYTTEKINELAVLNCANKYLQEEVNKEVQMQSMVVASNMIMLHTIQRMNLNRINSSNINRFNRF